MSSLNGERQIEIKSALHQYREVVSQHSLTLLRVLVESIEAQSLPPNYPASIVQSLRMDLLRKYLYGDLPESVKTPRDILRDDVRVEVIGEASLDGVFDVPVDQEERGRYFAAIQTRISEKNVEAEEFPPADLQYLCTLVSGITGPGLPYHREMQQFAFVSSMRYQNFDEMVDCVLVPIRDKDGEQYDTFTYVWEEWEIAVAIRIGTGPREWGGSYVLYCRKEQDEAWKWRYGIHDEDWRSDLYDSVEKFLDFYAHFREQTEEDVKSDIRSLQSLL